MRRLGLAAALLALAGCGSAHERAADSGIEDGGIEVRCGEIIYCWPFSDGGRLLPYCSISCDAAAGYDGPICLGSEVPDAEVPWAPYCPSGATPFCAPPRPDRCGE